MLKIAEKRELTKRVQEYLAECPEVRPFPASVTQLLAACQDANANAEKFVRIIECDPGLAVRVLRMANSPLYGFANEVRSINHAISILGIRQLKNLALVVAGRAMFSEGSTAAKERQDLWNHSLGCAAVARVLAKSVSTVSPEDAFLAGIFHDVGKLFLYDVVADEYAQMASLYIGEKLATEERFVFGINHQEIGLKAAHAWGLPEDVKAVIGHHHQPEASPIHSDLVTVVHFSNRLARAWGIGSEVATDSDIFAQTAEQLVLDEELLASVKEQVHEAFDEAAHTLA